MRPPRAGSPLLALAAPAAPLALVALVLLAASAPARAQTVPPGAATGAPAPWRAVIVVDPRAVLRAQHQRALKRKPTPRPRVHASPGAEVFERYDTAPSPRPR